ncbi:MAG: TetR/AcrR family transcriptional regulator [Saccharofermentans sp.]|nr:TetR/AcrR family transcriptional regulator [Saccharofermentans sp.]
MAAVDKELKLKIMQSAARVFAAKGLKFRMDDIALDMSISKKTIYTVFDTKEKLLSSMVDMAFANIKKSEQEVLDRNDLGTVEKLKALLAAMPEGYGDLNLRELDALKEKYPKVYKKVQKKLESGWEPTIELLKQGKLEGVIRQDANIMILKAMMEASIERFFSDDVLKRNGLTYLEGLNEVVEILIEGIVC